MAFANDYAQHDGNLRVLCVSQHGIVRRSDAFVFELDGSIILLDAGLPEVHYALIKLLEIRAGYLKGHEDFLEKKDVKLKITWIVSHMHIDHIGAFMDHISSSPYIYVERAYLPPKTEYYDPNLSPDWDGDCKYRERMAGCFREFQPWCEIIDIPFSKTETFEFDMADSKVTLLPPTDDWGRPDFAERCRVMYVAEGSVKSLPIAICNANSQWVVLEYKGIKFVFTGDAMKKHDIDNENFDVMLENWKDKVSGVEVFKYPHHGILRDAAAIPISKIAPQYVLCNAIDTTAPAVFEARRGENAEDITCVLFGYEDKCFLVDETGKLKLV